MPRAKSNPQSTLRPQDLVILLRLAPLKELIRPGTDPLPVWPHKDGTVRGIAFHPLYPSVPEAARRACLIY